LPHTVLAARMPGEAVEIFGVVCFEPFEQTAGNMMREWNGGVLFEDLNIRLVAQLVGFFNDMIEVADGLVRMQQADKADTSGHRMAAPR